MESACQHISTILQLKVQNSLSWQWTTQFTCNIQYMHHHAPIPKSHFDPCNGVHFSALPTSSKYRSNTKIPWLHVESRYRTDSLVFSSQLVDLRVQCVILRHLGWGCFTLAVEFFRSNQKLFVDARCCHMMPLFHWAFSSTTLLSCVVM